MLRNLIFIALFAIFVVSASSEKKGDEKDTKDLEQSPSLGWGWGWPAQVHHGWGGHSYTHRVNHYGWGGWCHQHHHQHHQHQHGWGWPVHGWEWGH